MAPGPTRRRRRLLLRRATSGLDVIRSRPQAADPGSASLELVALFPVVLLVIFGLVQGALWYHARDVATTAASEGAAAARAEGGSAEDGRRQAASFLSQNVDAVLDVAVDASRDATRVRVTVTGRSVSLLPGVPGPAVRESVAGPVERFTSRGAG